MRLTPRVAGFRSEYPAGFKLECMAGFVGTRSIWQYAGKPFSFCNKICQNRTFEPGRIFYRTADLANLPETSGEALR
jgi:hypothetical protein